MDRLAQSRRRPEPRTEFPQPVPRKKEKPADEPAAETPAVEEPQAEAAPEAGDDE